MSYNCQNKKVILILLFIFPSLIGYSQTKIGKKESLDSIISKLPDSLLAIPANERYEMYKLEIEDGRSADSSALNRTKGMLYIGDYRINLSFFSDFSQEAFFHKLTWPDSILYVAEVSTGRSVSNDTTILFSKPLTAAQKTRLKPTRKKMDYDNFSHNYGFGNDCPPGDCKHYFIGLTTRNNILRVDNPGEIKKLLPRIRNPYDAWFMLEAAMYWPRGKFAKVNDGFLVLINKRTRDCQIDYADILYHVHQSGHVKELGRVLTQKTTLCF